MIPTNVQRQQTQCPTDSPTDKHAFQLWRCHHEVTDTNEEVQNNNNNDYYYDNDGDDTKVTSTSNTQPTLTTNDDDDDDDDDTKAALPSNNTQPTIPNQSINPSHTLVDVVSSLIAVPSVIS